MFPLPLSDFEYYMLVDDRPSHPMVFVMSAKVIGQFQQAAFQQSLDALIHSHPLLHCTVGEIADKGWCWTPASHTAGHLEWEDTDDLAVARFCPQVRAIDLKTAVGLQVVVRASPTCARLILYIHHCCCDGIGGLQVIGELLARYGQKTAAAGDRKPVFEEPQTELLLERENYNAGDATAERHKKSLGKTLGKISRLLLRKPCLLKSSDVADLKSSSHDPERAPVILEAIIPKSIHRNLRAVAASFKVSLNDLLVGRFLLHIRTWNSRRTRSNDNHWIRLSVPVSMRTPLHARMPAANVVSYAFVTRREKECDDMAALLTSIHEQTGDVVFNREGIVCLKIFRVLRKMPRGMKLFLGLKSCLSTAVLANIGDIRRRFSGRFPLNEGKWVAGDVLVESLTGVAPVRPNTRAAISIGEYAGELSISLRTDANSICATDAQRFLAEFVDDLKRLQSCE